MGATSCVIITWLFQFTVHKYIYPPLNSDMDYRIFNVRTFSCNAYTHTGVGHTDNESAQHFDSGKNCHTFFLCPGRDSNLCPWNPSDLEADAPPIEPPRPPFMHCTIPYGKFGPLYLGKASAAARAALPSPTGCLLGLFVFP